MKTKPTTKTILILIVTILMIVNGCKKKEDTKEEDVIIPSTTKVISKTDMQNNLISVDTSSHTYVFEQGISSYNIKAGDIIVSSEEEGSLRKVTSIETINNQIVVTTTDATLTEAIEKGTCSFSLNLSSDKIKSIKYFEKGISLDTNTLKSNLGLDISLDFILYDNDGNPSTTDDQVKIEGNLFIDPTITGEFIINDFSLEKLKIEFANQLITSITGSSTLGEQTQVDKILAEYKFSPIIIPVGAVPVVVTPKLELHGGFILGTPFPITANIEDNSSFTASLLYENSNWTSYKTVDNTFTYNLPILANDAFFTVYIKPELKLMIYGTLAPYIEPKFYAEIDAHIQSIPWWELYGGFDLGAGVKMKAFGHSILDYYILLYEYKEKIAEAPTQTNLPTVNTSAITNITETSAICGGDVTSDGGATVTARGVCWGISSNPTFSDNHTTEGSGTGSFASNITGLVANTPYYVRAYATNSAGTVYGEQFSFTTSGTSGGQPCPGTPTVVYEGKTYNTVQIGTQCWLKENLNVGTHINGTQSQNGTNGIIEKYCYDDLESNCDIYGGLYQWDEMMKGSTTPCVQGICPSGWHLPSDAEWTTLTDNLGGGGIAGGKLKETGTTYWQSPNVGATNESGFSALPGGYRHDGGTFYNIGIYGDWWSSTESVTSYAYGRYLSYGGSGVGRGSGTDEIDGFSVRCVRD